MNPTHRTRRLPVTVAALAAAALALPACQGTATAAGHHHAAQATAQQTQNGLTATDLKDLAKMKRDLLRRLAQQTQDGLTVTDLKDHAEVKRGQPVVAGQPRVGKAWEHRRKFGGAGPAAGC